MNSPLTIAVASGKGGTGKTTVAAHLARTLARYRKTVLIDLDVEAPDSLGYFPDARVDRPPRDVKVLVPKLIPERCTGCGLCAKACRFGAVVSIGGVVTIEKDICKGCGHCIAVCPADALIEEEIQVGTVSRHRDGALSFVEGKLAIGDIRATAVIEAAKHAAAGIPGVHVRDCPPGVTCPTVHALEGADYVVLVAEPTAFSLHDLDAAIRLAQSQNVPIGIVINKFGFGPADVEAFAAERDIPVLGRIPFSRGRAESGARGKLWDENTESTREIEELAERILSAARTGRKE